MKRRAALMALTPLLWLALGFVALRYLTAIVSNPDKAWSIARMIDEGANVGANGQVNTTISARAGRAAAAHRRWGCLLCALLDAIDPHHCADAVASEESPK